VKKKFWFIGALAALAIALAAVFFAAHGSSETTIGAGGANAIAAAPPQNADFLPFAGAVGIAFLIVFSTLAWIVPIELAWDGELGWKNK
jgi:hypothetical protein